MEYKSYEDFLLQKEVNHIESGFDVDESALNLNLFEFQKFCVRRALKHGRYAIFSGTGTGKSYMELSFADEVVKRTDKPVLILAFLAVVDQTIRIAKSIGIEVKLWNEHWQSRYEDCNSPMEKGGIFISNYEQLDNINADLFVGVIADEAGIIKNYQGAIRNKLIHGFAKTTYKLSCTATPSPNDPMELGNQCEFLNVMGRNEMLAMYFVHDGGQTSKWRIKKHAEQKFWDWVSTWAIMFSTPQDIGFSNDGYDLPPLNIIEKEIKTEKRDNGLLYNDTAVSATNFNKELRLTKNERLDMAAEIANNSNEIFLIWIKHNPEGAYLKSLIPNAVEITGKDSIEFKREKLLAFADGMIRVLITKDKIAGWGLNFQVCHNQIAASPDFSFESLFQRSRRSYRFGQKEPVNIYIITTDTMQNVSESFKRKQEAHEKMQSAMIKAMSRNLHRNEQKQDHMYEEVKTENYHLMMGDCVKLIKTIPDKSIHFSVWSPPFLDLYVYSDQIEDMGNSRDPKEFLTAFKFLVSEIKRVMMDGRLVAVHCMDLPIQKGKEGYIGLRKFSHMIWDTFIDAGFIGHDEIVCWKDPVIEMQRTKALGLLHKQLKKDSSMCRTGIPDKILVFRNTSVNPIPIPHQDKDSERPDYFPVSKWQQWASPVWMDIDFGNTLNYRAGREESDEKHIAPLSLDIIERCIGLWSNENETVLTCFGGVGSEAYQALKMNRKAILMELKKSYFDEAVKNCAAIMESKKQLELFLSSTV